MNAIDSAQESTQPPQPYQKGTIERHWDDLSDMEEKIDTLASKIIKDPNVDYQQISRDIQKAMQEIKGRIKISIESEQKSMAAKLLCKKIKREGQIANSPLKTANALINPKKLNDSLSSDVILECDNCHFHVHRELLTKAPSYFDGLLGEYFREGDLVADAENNRKAAPILLQDISAHTLATILIYLYTGRLYLQENLFEVICGADYLSIEDLCQKCTSLLKKKFSRQVLTRSYLILGSCFFGQAPQSEK